ncbi:MAG: tRNA(Ile)-lysidine synthase [Candidatus Dichloromethanomonas elyunquensis]|nr:MAG: tRNA(Ile)-lysidine synthase [Candidatus Dichloromethanomonas elyunquensis]
MYQSLSLEVLPQLIPPQSGVLAAVSGGPDSVAMAHIIWRYIRENTDQGLRMVINHVNHKMRVEAEEEAELVKRLAGMWGVPYIYHEFNAKKYAVERRKSFQEASREWRYAHWKEDMEQFELNLLATAHHLGDQAETVLYRMLRGSGTAGLAGIYPVKEGIIRPLLSVSKKEILAYCQEEELPYAIDKSNDKPCYDRNRIRLELLPELEKKYNDKIQESLGRMAEVLRWDEEFINSQVDKVWSRYCKETPESRIEISLKVWGQPNAILSRILRRAARKITGEPRGLEYRYIKNMMKYGKKTGWKQDFPGFQVEAGRDGFFFFRRELESEAASFPDQFKTMEIQLPVDQWNAIPDLGLKVGIFRSLFQDKNILWSSEFDLNQISKLSAPLICRMRRPGDKMYLRAIGHKELKKVFQENKISDKERFEIPLFATGNSVVWIPGICRSDSLLPKDESSKVFGFIAKN